MPVCCIPAKVWGNGGADCVRINPTQNTFSLTMSKNSLFKTCVCHGIVQQHMHPMGFNYVLIDVGVSQIEHSHWRGPYPCTRVVHNVFAMAVYTLSTLQNVRNIIAQQQQQQSIIDAVELNHTNYSSPQIYELNRFQNNVSELADYYIECGYGGG